MELSTRYTPKDIEEPLYTKWNDSGCFQPPAEGEGSGKPFTVMIPPPNVTGVLHMGHALNGTVQDIVVRHRRKSGFDTLWVPGTDHAGIATQAVVEKRIYAEEGTGTLAGRHHCRVQTPSPLNRQQAIYSYINLLIISLPAQEPAA